MPFKRSHSQTHRHDLRFIPVSLLLRCDALQHQSAKFSITLKVFLLFFIHRHSSKLTVMHFRNSLLLKDIYWQNFAGTESGRECKCLKIKLIFYWCLHDRVVWVAEQSEYFAQQKHGIWKMKLLMKTFFYKFQLFSIFNHTSFTN